MPVGDYLEGGVLLAVVLGATFAGSWFLLVRRLPSLRGVERVVGYGVVATAGLLAVHILPAALGLLGRGSVLIAALAWLAACAAVPAVAPPEPEDEPRPRRDAHAPVSMPLAWAAVGLAGIFLLAFVADQFAVPSSSADFMNFHLPSVIEWIQEGSLWQVDSFLPAVAPGHYPNNGDVLVLAFVLPWHNDFLAHLAIWPFFLLTGLGTYAIARRLGAPRSAAMMGGALMLAIPVVAVAALAHGITDSVTLFGFAAGVLFLLRHHRTGATSDLVLAGIALGISFGAKWYGVSAVAIVVAVWALARLAGGSRWRTVLGQTAAIAGLIGLAGGIWLLRNWIESGNPVFPVRVAPLGITLFDAPPDVTRELAGFTIADYLGDWDPWWKLEGNPELGGRVLDGILLQWWHSLGAPALLAVAGSVVAAALLLAGRIRTRARGVLLASGIAMGLIVAAYAITPYTAGGPADLPFLVGADSRYVVPAIVIGAALTAWAAGRLRWGTVGLGLLTLAAMAQGIQWAGKGELSAAHLTARNWIAAAVLAACVALATWALEPWWRRLAGRRVRTFAAVALCALLGLGAAAGGHGLQKRFNDDRYRGADPAVDAIVANSGEGIRVGLAGVWTDDGISPVLPAFGPRFENEVEYVGPVVREMRRSYDTRSAFLAAVERGAYDALLVGRGRPELPPPREDDWARSGGWQLIERSDRLELYTPPG